MAAEQVAALRAGATTRRICPAWGGTLPPLPERLPVPDPSGDLDTDEDITAQP